jgi:hypothetical protein
MVTVLVAVAEQEAEDIATTVYMVVEEGEAETESLWAVFNPVAGIQL